MFILQILYTISMACMLGFCFAGLTIRLGRYLDKPPLDQLAINVAGALVFFLVGGLISSAITSNLTLITIFALTLPVGFVVSLLAFETADNLRDKEDEKNKVTNGT